MDNLGPTPQYFVLSSPQQMSHNTEHDIEGDKNDFIEMSTDGHTSNTPEELKCYGPQVSIDCHVAETPDAPTCGAQLSIDGLFTESLEELKCGGPQMLSDGHCTNTPNEMTCERPQLSIDDYATDILDCEGAVALMPAKQTGRPLEDTNICGNETLKQCEGPVMPMSPKQTGPPSENISFCDDETPQQKERSEKRRTRWHRESEEFRGILLACSARDSLANCPQNVDNVGTQSIEHVPMDSSASCSSERESNGDMLALQINEELNFENNTYLDSSFKIKHKSVGNEPSVNQDAEVDIGKFEPYVVQFVDAIYAALAALPQHSLIDILHRLMQNRSTDFALAMDMARLQTSHDQMVFEPRAEFVAKSTPSFSSTTPAEVKSNCQQDGFAGDVALVTSSQAPLGATSVGSYYNDAKNNTFVEPVPIPVSTKVASPRNREAEIESRNGFPFQGVIEFASDSQTAMNDVSDPSILTVEMLTAGQIFGEEWKESLNWLSDTPNAGKPTAIWASTGNVPVPQNVARPLPAGDIPQIAPISSLRLPLDVAQCASGPGLGAPSTVPAPELDVTFSTPRSWFPNDPRPAFSPKNTIASDFPIASALRATTPRVTNCVIPARSAKSPFAHPRAAEMEFSMASTASKTSAPWPSIMHPKVSTWQKMPVWTPM